MNPIRGNPKDFWTGVVYIFFGATALVVSRDYGMGTAVKMGPAYFPTLLSALLILIGIISIVRSVFQSGSPVEVIAWKGLALVVVSTLLFGLTVRGLGVIVALPLLVIVSGSASRRFNWKYALAEAVGITVFCILVFVKGLGVPLPIVGSWLAR